MDCARWISCVSTLVLLGGCNGKGTEGDPDDAAADLAEDPGADEATEDPDAADVPGEDVEEEDAGDADWGNPGCEASPRVIEDGLRLDITVDLASWAEGRYLVTERATVTAPEAGSALSFFGIALDMMWASVPYDYDGELATFCTDPFEAGDDVTVEARFEVTEASVAMGLRRWAASDGSLVVVGPSQEPYFAPYWILVPQSTFQADAVHDDSPAVEALDLTIVAPDATWTVIGPGGPGVRDGLAWSFSLHQVQPIYDISFAASPDYEVFDVGTTTTGVKVTGAVSAARRGDAGSCFEAAITTIEWMEANVGPWEWGDDLALVEIPDYGGAMEHTTAMWFGSDTIVSGPEGENIVVHETVHHWWGNSVRFADWPHFWLAEGFDEWHTNFNIMGELLTAEEFARLRSLYRERAAEETYPYMPSWPDPGPLRFADDQDVMIQWMLNMSLFYVYGACFLEMVDQRLQRDFSTDLNTLLAAWYDARRLDQVTTEEFLAFLQAQTGDIATWQDLFDEWVYVTPAPTLELSDYQYAAGVASFTVNRADGAGQGMPGLEIVLESGSDRTSTSVDLPEGTDTAVASVAVPAEPDRIVLDPDIFYIFRVRTEAGWAGPEAGFEY